MAELRTRYAAALFELAVERGVLDAVQAQASAVREAFVDADARRFINHPNIAKAEKIGFVDAVLDKLFPDGAQADFRGYLHLLVTKSRESVMVSSLESFDRMADDYNKKTTARVSSAVPLSTAQMEKLKTVLSEKINKTVNVVNEVDASLIGGVCIYVDGFQADRSVKNQLDGLRDKLVLSY
jgi:F-type H+-transporting ATPase subunit delta